MMQLERLTPTKYRITLHAYELAAIISAARWIADGAKGELPSEAVEKLSRIVATYDAESKRINKQQENY